MNSFYRNRQTFISASSLRILVSVHFLLSIQVCFPDFLFFTFLVSSRYTRIMRIWSFLTLLGVIESRILLVFIFLLFLCDLQ